jgi:hypothetical protein
MTIFTSGISLVIHGSARIRYSSPLYAQILPKKRTVDYRLAQGALSCLGLIECVGLHGAFRAVCRADSHHVIHIVAVSDDLICPVEAKLPEAIRSFARKLVSDMGLGIMHRQNDGEAMLELQADVEPHRSLLHVEDFRPKLAELLDKPSIAPQLAQRLPIPDPRNRLVRYSRIEIRTERGRQCFIEQQ